MRKVNTPYIDRLKLKDRGKKRRSRLKTDRQMIQIYLQKINSYRRSCAVERSSRKRYLESWSYDGYKGSAWYKIWREARKAEIRDLRRVREIIRDRGISDNFIALRANL